MTDNEPLLDVAAALADGTAVDWESAAQSTTSDGERRLLAELRFIADMAGAPQAERAAHVAGEFWGPLKILEHVDRGSFGDVYRAWDSRLDREVALKILRGRERDDEMRESTVIQEGRLLARLRHPNIATVYGAERIGGQVGMWMEFIHGKTLEQELREHGPFEPDRVIRIGIELADALSTIHRAGLLHRDVKAQNVLSDRDGRLVLTDFGAGCEALQEPGAGAAVDLAGTPISVAPESLEGRPATPQSDVYSLGVLLYHLLTGTYPVRGKSLREIRDAHAHGRRTPLADARPDLPGPLVRVVDRAIDPNPGRRYESPETFGSELAALVQPRVSSTSAPRGRRLALVALGLMSGVLLWLAVGSGRGDRLTGASIPAGSGHPEIELVEAITLTDQGRVEDAYERARQTRSTHPKSADAGVAVAYTLTYAGFLDDAVRAIETALAASPEYIELNGWWTPTALLYTRQHDRFLHPIRRLDSPSARLYRALAEVERGRTQDAMPHLVGIESGTTNVFNGLAQALHASLTGRQDDASAMIRSVVDHRRTSGDRDGEITFKLAQILAIAGQAPAALAMLDQAVDQGFVCVTCAETSSPLAAVRALPGYVDVRGRALARHTAFGQRFGLSTISSFGRHVR